MPCYCKCSVTLPHGAVAGLRCVIVVFPDYTHLRFGTEDFSLRGFSWVFYFCIVKIYEILRYNWNAQCHRTRWNH